MRRVERVNVAFMLSGMGSGGVDVFKMASTQWEKRQAKALGEAKIRMTKQKGTDDKSNIFWNNLWGQSKDRRNSVNADEEANERARRAAAAARR
ncbi:hypothetical protein MLD38_033302 [Melastoma candidum]|uniref:Uncharacterized protein n=1 Tax=Melastoma candidum TaxID=119954 RepID=A0ACB9M647_9MYRT|nr:hypothetical protein MLD38_033302 [Melastoma candidum]